MGSIARAIMVSNVLYAACINWLHLATVLYCIIVALLSVSFHLTMSIICCVCSPCHFGCSNKYSPAELFDSQLPHYVRNCIALPPYLCLFLYVFNSLYLSYLPVMNFYALSLTFIVFISAFPRSLSPLLPRVCLPLFVVCFCFLQTF